jgi:hypothetical protein
MIHPHPRDRLLPRRERYEALHPQRVPRLGDGTGNRPPVKVAKTQAEKIFRPKTCVGSPVSKNAQAATLTDNAY